MASPTVSSRTPEGEPAHCPVCGTLVQVEPSVIFSDAPCPSCGSLTWFVRLGEQCLVFRPNEKALNKGLVKVLTELTGASEEELQRDPEWSSRLELDSTQLIELLLDLES